VLGCERTLATPQIAMVGARNASASGRATAFEFAAAFARAGLTVVSGLALGIDTASHRGALEAGGLTVAVCGHGLAHLYPRDNRALARRIREHGALMSALPPDAGVRAWHFPARNRLISGLARATLVIEASHRSGSLMTARCARRQGRRVFAVPGSIRDPSARGCHELIRGGATLIGSAADALTDLGIPFENQTLMGKQAAPAARSQRGPPLDKAYEMLLDALGFEPASLDQLGERTGIPGAALAGMLLMLELGGRVAPHPGGYYCRLS
jgi:DNA processing protein